MSDKGEGEDTLLGNGWMTKRRRQKSPEIVLQNRFSVLQTDHSQTDKQTPVPEPGDSEQMQTEEQESDAAVQHRPPPLFIDEREIEIDIEKLTQLLDKLVGRPSYKYESKNREVQVNTFHINAFKTITNYFKKNNVPYYTSQMKADRAFKVMIKNIHHSYPILSMTDAINAEGHTVRRINKKWNKKGGFWWNMFELELEPAPNNKDIYHLKHIDHHIVQVEPLYKKGLVPQCTNCQLKGHTKNYCNLSPKCVKCGGDHESIKCPKDKNTEPKCSNCQGTHTANYRGCPYLKPLIRRPRIEQNTSTNNNYHHQPENFPNLRGNNYQSDVQQNVPLTNPWNTFNGQDNRNEYNKLESLIKQQLEMTNNLIQLIQQLISSKNCQCHK